MAKQIKLGFTDYSTLVFIPDSASTDGSGKTGLVAANLTVSYARVETDNDVTITDATSSLNNLAALTSAHNDWGLLEVSNTLAPGLYRLDIADAVFASGAWTAVVYVMVTTSAAAASPIEFELVAFDPLDTVRMGLTALPNAAAEAAGGLYTRGSGAGQINQNANGQVDTRTVAMAANVLTDTAINADAFTAAKFAADVTTEFQNGLATAAALATVDGIVDDILLDTAEIGAAGAGLTNINLPDQTMNITGNITGNLTGTIGGLTAAALKDFFDTDSTTTYASAVSGSVVKEIADNAGGGTPPSAADIADAVWEEAIADHSGTAGSTAEALNAAGAAGDPWITALPGAYGAGSAGFIVGTNINATISSRATQASVDTIDANVDDILDDTGTSGVVVDTINADAVTASALDATAITEIQSGLATSAAVAAIDTDVDAIKAKTDSLTFSVAGQANVNIKSVADTTVTGSGTAGDPWGPA